jgi:hypothetical protein
VGGKLLESSPFVGQLLATVSNARLECCQRSTEDYASALALEQAFLTTEAVDGAVRCRQPGWHGRSRGLDAA